MKISSKFLASWIIVSGVSGLSAAHAQSAPGTAIRFVPGMLPSTGSLLQSTPDLLVPDAPRSNTPVEPVEIHKAAPSESTKGEVIHVVRIEVDDVPPALQSRVNSIVAAYQDRNLTFGELRDIAAEISEALVSAGEALSYAMIPPQKVEGGVIRMAVISGHLESVVLGKNKSRVSDTVLERYMQRIQNESTNIVRAQAEISRLADLPGIGGISPVLAAGTQPGGSILTLGIAAEPAVEAVLVADNNGSETTGRNRIGFQFTANSPLKIGDRFQFMGYAAPDIFQFTSNSNSGYTLLGRASYDLPIGAAGMRAGLAFARVNYALGGLYKGIGDGNANIVTLYANKSLIRKHNNDLSLSASLDYKSMRDTIVSSDNKRSDLVAGLQVSGNYGSTLAGRPNAIQYEAGIGAGRIDNPDPFWGVSTDGRFYKATQNVRVTQSLVSDVLLEMAWNGQQASRTLDSVEKMALGGPGAVRAYTTDAASVDSGWIGSVVLSTGVPKVKGLRAQIFYEMAHGKPQKFGARGVSPSVNLSGYGAGLNYTAGNRANVSISYARPIKSIAAGGHASGAVWVNTALKI
ncbi:ShlB/FhaC/HecB family hemolysin secretion/activation protein [Paraburkholderia bonniea]|uniref:ShlB/FhaC/HecB family hemolysin secretion/activation protein n=1 Tax=Paraburkholderia bonniea TaxID=2152891 RepID=UPI00129274B4|nr:ShlB/FhaC/HecB family hemolysin secretion/activation protein [Paraburkholderia bonniea]WJF89012.1 ShlB/FhaC/HecB family hemolysin secretion/activation protein [Paraburkholderia bonniea]WJF92328.1 ShlB/FhaC/HecB family hemolysin secretion/activation protein [Paraburkholderia bonniea]